LACSGQGAWLFSIKVHKEDSPMSKDIIRPEQFRTIPGLVVLNTNAETLSPQQLQELSDLYEGLFDSFTPGKIVKGTIIKVDSDGVLVDINFKSRGLIPKYEFAEHELKNLKEGQDIEVMIDTLESADGNVILSYEQAKAMRAWDAIVKLFEENKPVEGIVTHKVKGGLSVDIGIPAFLPGSQIDLQRVSDFDQYLGQTIKASILKINKKRGNVIISRRKYLSDQRAENRKDILSTLAVNQIIRGTVKNITNYGVFIDIGGVDGLLHITDMTWGRIGHPSEMVKMGDQINVKILSFDKDNEKISLGLKQLDQNPWEKVSETLKEGSRIKGKISSITDYGLFVEVAPNIEGLVHISEISWTSRISNLSNRFKVGEEIEILVVSMDKENRRMSLSIKQLEQNPWEMVNEKFKVGQRITGKISNITDFGIFVQLMPGIDGLVHISDLSWTEHIDHPRDRYQVGQEVEAIILTIDTANKKISLGIKQLSKDPWENVESDYPVNSIVQGDVAKITNFGAFIRMPTGIEGLIHNTTLVEHQGKKADEVLTVGQKEQFRILSVSKKDRKLGLTMKLDFDKNAPQPVVEAAPKQQQQPRAPKKSENPSVQHQAQQQSSAPKAKSSLQLALESMQERNSDAADKKDQE
jgi:small subunit ribosomal protein S1